MAARRKQFTSAQDSLFGPAPEAYQPRIYRCETCGDGACYGLGWPTHHPEQWFCRHHVPAGFLPQQRSVHGQAA